MKNQGLWDLFIEECADMLNAETQITHFLPKAIKLAHAPDLKEALTHHLKETENQISRLRQVFELLDQEESQETCDGIQGILTENQKQVRGHSSGPATDALIIAGCQKVEHYEMASYGTLIAWAKQLDFDSEVVDLLKATYDEESAADKKLSKLAEGGLIFSGINKAAAESKPRR